MGERIHERIEGLEVDPANEVARIRTIVERISEFSAQELDDWAEEALPWVQFGVEGAADAMGLADFSWNAWSGIQGAGKGTNLRAISEAAQDFSQLHGNEQMPNTLDKLVTSYSGEMGFLQSGTGGMFVPPEDGEYRDIFDKVGKIISTYTDAGTLVPDSVTTVLAGLMIQKRIYEGYDSMQVDLVPRTEVQHELVTKQLEKLDKAGIQTHMDLLDLRLMPKDAIERVNADRNLYAEKSKQFGDGLKIWMKANKERISPLESQEQLVAIQEMLKSYKEFTTDDDAMQDIVSEVEAAFVRVGERLEKEGRVDDQPWSTLNRIRSYEQSTAPSYLLLEDVKIISAYQEPEKVVEDVILALVGEDDKDNEMVREFVEVAQKKARNIVDGVKN